MNWTRKPAVAGTFYSDNAQSLRQTLELLLQTRSPGPARALIAPHAGYRYSGAIAAKGYERTTIPDRLFVICPNHTGQGDAISVWAQGTWETPIGSCDIDTELANRFLENCPQAKASQEAHLNEHAIEVHVPFIQTLNPNAKIVPIVLGHLSLEHCTVIGQALGKTIEESEDSILMIASTDMSHFIPAKTAKTLDTLALKNIETLDGEGLYNVVCEKDISMCGFIPTAVVIEASKRLGAQKAELIAYGNSGEQTQDFESVVAYATAIIP